MPNEHPAQPGPTWGASQTLFAQTLYGWGNLTRQYVDAVARNQQLFDAAFQRLLSAGRTAGTSQAEVVARNGVARLLRYQATRPGSGQVPLLLVPSPFNRPAMFDLMPGQSLVEYLLDHGVDVFLLDWGVPTRESRSITLDQQISGILGQAVQQVADLAGRNTISMLGYSAGGTFAAIYAALFPQQLAGLALLAAPINFHDNGLISQWTRKERFNVDLVVDTLGAMPLELLQASFRLLTPSLQIGQQIALAERLGDVQAVQDFLAMQAWFDDNMLFLGEAYRSYIKECYQENALRHGRLVIDGQRVDLAQISCPLLVATANADCICPPQSAAVISELVSSQHKQLIELASGHIGVVAGRAAAEHLWPALATWLATHGR